MLIKSKKTSAAPPLYISKQLQDICKVIEEYGQKDKNYWLTGQQYKDVMNSKQYSNVVLLDKIAMKPWFLIIYKSEYAGICMSWFVIKC